MICLEKRKPNKKLNLRGIFRKQPSHRWASVHLREANYPVGEERTASLFGSVSVCRPHVFNHPAWEVEISEGHGENFFFVTEGSVVLQVYLAVNRLTLLFLPSTELDSRRRLKKAVVLKCLITSAPLILNPYALKAHVKKWLDSCI